MKLSEKTLEDMGRFFAEGSRGEVSLADRGCTCFMNAPCSRCTHPGNPVCVDEVECWASPEDAEEYAALLAETSLFLYQLDFRRVIQHDTVHQFRSWSDYAHRRIELFWDFDSNSPVFKAFYGSWRTSWFPTAEAAFVAAELDNWGRDAPLHEIAAMMSAEFKGTHLG